MSSSLQLDLLAPRWTTVSSPSSFPGLKLPYEDPFLADNRLLLEKAAGERLIFDEKSWNHSSAAPVGLDVEVFYNCFIVCFKRFEDGKRLAFEFSERSELNVKGIRWVLSRNLTVSFNGYYYDLPIIFLALNGASLIELKEASNKLIHGSYKPWQMESALGIRVPKLNHIDLIDSNPSVKQGLKMLNGRLHGRYMVDFPFDYEAMLTRDEMNIATLYCHNDLDSTELVFNAMREPLDLRVALGKQCNLDLRSKSDAQIGEAIVKRKIEIETKRRVGNEGAKISTFQYIAPDFLRFESEELKKLLRSIDHTTFFVNGFGKIDTPPFLNNLTVKLGGMTYAMGIGGIHSTEAHRAVYSNTTHRLIDVDVASQYPNIIMKLGLCPKPIGPAFLQVYGALIKERLAAKAAGDKVRADGGRIALNGVYGKLGSPYSVLYGPDLLIAITLTGQLSILMLIERVEREGISVVSANTDGVLFYCPRDKEDRLSEIIAEWERDTGLVIEKTYYRSIFNSSVNTYFAVKEDGKVKRKGTITNPWKEGDLRGQMMKNPQMNICADAVVELVLNETPLEETIRNCKDPREFITVVKVTGSALWRGHKLGRAVRYYWSLDGDPIFYADGSRRVSKTEGARPMAKLTDILPEDVDYLRYCEEAFKLSQDLGVLPP